jgi:hypothetical protein
VLIDVTNAPDDPIQRLIWLSDIQDQALAVIDQQAQLAYFQARMQGQLDTAIDLGLHAKKQIIAMTRHENENRGRLIRWGDDYNAAEKERMRRQRQAQD